MKSSAQNLSLTTNFIFQDDNDPKHTAKICRDFIENEGITRLEWPGQSPDLNPIEHLWEEIDREIRKHHISSLSMLKEHISKAWENIGPEVARNLVSSMKRRCEAVIISKGGPTKY